MRKEIEIANIGDFTVERAERRQLGVEGKSRQILNEREGGQKDRKGKVEKDPPVSEVSGNRSWHVFSAGGESAVQTTRQHLLSLLSIHPSSLSSLSTHHKCYRMQAEGCRRNRSGKKEGGKNTNANNRFKSF